MNVIKEHEKLYADKYVKQMIKLCNDFYEKYYDKKPTDDEIRAFTYGHLCGKNKVNNKDEIYKIK